MWHERPVRVNVSSFTRRHGAMEEIASHEWSSIVFIDFLQTFARR